MNLSYVVNSNCIYQSVRQILKNEFKISSRLLLQLKLHNKIYLNNVPVYLDKSLTLDDIISVNLDLEEDNSNIVPNNISLDILYEDDSFLIVNKPPNMAVHPSILHYNNSLSNGIKYYFDCINLNKKIRPINRLDKDTSGIVIFAKNQYVQERLSSQMKNNIFKKEYIAVLDGFLKDKVGEINAPIARKEGSIIERIISSDGAPSVTNYEVLKTFNNLSLVKFILKTGRTHQIRVHCKYIGHPIIGDTLYGKVSNLINRQALHSHKISFIHPISKLNMEFTAPIPQDIQNIFMKIL